MQTVPSRFDQILHVKRQAAWGGVASTTFSFRDGASYRPYIKVAGNPELREGMQVLALLRKPDDWSSLVGWKDPVTGALTVKRPDVYRRLLMRQAAIIIVVIATWYLGAHLSLLIGAIGPLAYGAWMTYRELRQAEADLREIELLGLHGNADTGTQVRNRDL